MWSFPGIFACFATRNNYDNNINAHGHVPDKRHGYRYRRPGLFPYRTAPPNDDILPDFSSLCSASCGDKQTI